MAVYRRSDRRRPVLVLLVLTALTLITLDLRGIGVVDAVRDAARDVFQPVQATVGSVVDPVADWFDGITRAGSLKEENASLRRELQEARGEQAAAVGALGENEALRELAGLTFIGDIPTVTAEVVAGAPGNFDRTIQIDRGTDDGVVEGMPVVAGEGLVGRVEAASSGRATVRLLTDAGSGVAVRLDQSAAVGVAGGDAGSDLLHLDFLQPKEAVVTEGDRALTAGLDAAAFPAGLPVGLVETIEEPGALDQGVTLRPLVDFDRLRFVRVLQWPA